MAQALPGQSFTMLHFFRNIFKSKFGLVLTMGFLALIALAFAMSDITGTNSNIGSVSAGDSVAVVGDGEITPAEFTAALNAELETRRQQNPTLTMEAMLAQDGATDSVLDRLMQRLALTQWGEEHGFRVGKRLVDSELVKIQAFQGPDGKFSRQAFDAVLQQQRLSEAAVRSDIASGLMAQQVLTPTSAGIVVPPSIARQYAVLLRERRKGAILNLPSTAFAPTAAPTNEQLTAYHKANGSKYIRPERRVIRYATFGAEALADLPAPTEAQIAARYNQDKAKYAASETRTLTQMVVPTQAAAAAIVREVAGGKSLAVSAREKGLSTTTVGPVSKSQLAGQTSQAVADAAFAAAQGAVATPTRGNLGWYVLRVDAVTRVPARTLAQARSEISTALAAEQRRAAFIDMATRVEEEFEAGSSLDDVAAEMKLELVNTAPLTADGRVYSSTETAPAALQPALRTAFEMEEGEPQIAEVVPGQTFLVFGVADITPSAVAPLAQIRDDVIADWRMAEGARLAGAAAERILQRVEKGATLAAAAAAEKVALPAPQPVDMGRPELAALPRIPPVLALYFSMAERTTKKLEGAQNAGWFVARLDDISVPRIEGNDPLIGQTQRELANALGSEYAEQLVGAAQASLGMEKNPAAIDAVVRQLTGSAQ
ncbi:SurA N-terminal domain-containing protein [Tsuneonella sp. HG222]